MFAKTWGRIRKSVDDYNIHRQVKRNDKNIRKELDRTLFEASKKINEELRKQLLENVQKWTEEMKQQHKEG